MWRVRRRNTANTIPINCGGHSVVFFFPVAVPARSCRATAALKPPSCTATGRILSGGLQQLLHADAELPLLSLTIQSFSSTESARFDKLSFLSSGLLPIHSLGLFLARSFAELARHLDLLVTALQESSEYLPTTFTFWAS
jgi:hypothetical protein